MEIGEALKALRLQAGMTQTEMADGIITESAYSKVERNVHSIDADVLFKILLAHHFDPITFFLNIGYKKENNGTLDVLNKMMYAQNKKDLHALDKIEAEIKEQYPDKIPDRLAFRLAMSKAWITHSSKNVDPKIKKKAKSLALNIDWDRNAYHYLSQACILMSIQDATKLFDIAAKSYRKNPLIDLMTITQISIMSLNFLNCCYHQHGESKYIDEAVQLVLSLPPDPAIGFFKVLALYYQALFADDEVKINALLQVIKATGFYPLIEDTIE